MYVSATVVRGLAAHLLRQGIAVERFCREAGLRVEQLNDPFCRLTFREYSDSVRSAQVLSRDPALALRVGQAAPAGFLALIGNLIVNCRTMRDAIAVYERFAMLITPDSTWALEEQSTTASFIYEFPRQHGNGKVFATELSMAVTMSFGEFFVGEHHAPLEARFSYRAPAYIAAYEQVFRCPIVFGAERSELVFDKALLDQQQLAFDEIAWSALRERAEGLLADLNTGSSIAERVRRALRYEADLGDVDCANVARRLGMTPRALRRRLRMEGQQLSTLIAEVKCELACARLREPESCIKELADYLGFSEPSAFHRAFKRWTGVTPAQYRSGCAPVYSMAG